MDHPGDHGRLCGSSRHDITIIGAGIKGICQLTREAEEAITSARAVFCSIYNAGMPEHVRQLNPNATIHCEEENEYKLGMLRPQMYQRIARRVIERARQESGVVVLHPGSAMVVDLITQGILKGAAGAGLSVCVLPGISSVESVLAVLGYDISDGLQIVLAQKLVLRRPMLDPRVAAMVLQPAYYDTLHFAGAPQSRPERFTALQENLTNLYGVDAPAALVIAPMAGAHAGRQFWFRLGQMHRLHTHLSPLHTLFVPASVPALDDDINFAARIHSWEACLSQIVSGGELGVVQQEPRTLFEAPVDPTEDLAAESERLARQWSRRE